MDGLLSLCLSFRIKPSIRYAKKSRACYYLANELEELLEKHTINLQNNNDTEFVEIDSSPTLLILHRNFDPITPLLTQWTYQAMLHEMFEIKNNCISSKSLSDKNYQKEIILSLENDEIYAKNAFLNYGEFAINIKELIDVYKNSVKSNAVLDTIEDIKVFLFLVFLILLAIC